jgi:hypothetical protein
VPARPTTNPRERDSSEQLQRRDRLELIANLRRETVLVEHQHHPGSVRPGHCRRTRTTNSFALRSGLPRLQIRTVGELLAGKGIDYPAIGGGNVTFKSARRVRTPTGEQLALGE